MADDATPVERTDAGSGALQRPPPPLDWRERLAAVVPLDRPAWQWVVAVVILAGLALGAWWALRVPPAPAPELILPMAGQSTVTGERETTTTAPVEVVVHAAGAVTTPGVYRLADGARVADLLDAADGALPDADVNRVNLAALLVDGQRYYVPRLGEEAQPVAMPDGVTPSTDDVSGPVDLNTASADDLDTLPGIGPATAEAIVEYRTRNGPFRVVEDLLDVRGIGDAKLDQLRGLVTV